MSEQYPTPSSPTMVPPKSQSTTSPSEITCWPASWWGLAALAPAATMAKFTRSWPSARIWRPNSAETSASVRPTSSIPPRWSRPAIRSTAAPAARRRSISVLSFTERIGAVTAEARRHAADGMAPHQLDQEARPHLIADRGHCRGPGQSGDDGHRVLGLVPGPDVEHLGTLGHPGRLHAGHDQRRLAVAGHHQHGETLQWHGLVPAEVRQVRPHRQQQHLDAVRGHQFPGPGPDARRTCPQA